MKNSIASIAILSVVILAVGGAQAAPIEPTRPPVSDVIQVRGLCGLGRHRDVWGGCLPNGVGYYYRPYYRPYYAYAAPYCWWRPGPVGPVRVCNY
jgi:hypothetical protein